VIAGIRGEASEMADALLDAAGARRKDSARGI
jgi:hypothetical protein